MMNPHEDITVALKHSTVDQLQKSRLFSSLPVHLLEKLSCFFETCHFSAAESITSEGEQSNDIYFLIKGKISVYSQGEFILSLRRLGDMCGETRVISERPCLSSDVAETPVETIRLNIEKLSRDSTETEDLRHLLTKLCSTILKDKLALTTKKAVTLDDRQTHLNQSREQLVKALKDCEKADKHKACFLDNINHELRTPMHGIMGITNLLQNTQLTDQQNKLTQIIQRSSDKLMSNIDDILSYTTIEAEQNAMEDLPFSLKKVSENLKTELLYKAKEKHLKISTTIAPEIPDLLLGDKTRIHQVLINLMSYSINLGKKGQVSLSISDLTSQSHKTTARFTVEFPTDDISGEEIDETLNAFSKTKPINPLDNSRSRLGLTISKQLVESMNGEIGVINGNGKKLLFWVVLELKEFENRRKETWQPLPTDRIHSRSNDTETFFVNMFEPNRQILLVENDRLARLVTELTLKKMGYIVTATSTKSRAYELLSLLRFDLILTNISDLGADGLTFRNKLEALETSMANPKIPIVAYTQDPILQKPERYKAAGMDEIVCHPLMNMELKSILRRWLPLDDFNG